VSLDFLLYLSANSSDSIQSRDHIANATLSLFIFSVPLVDLNKLIFIVKNNCLPWEICDFDRLLLLIFYFALHLLIKLVYFGFKNWRHSISSLLKGIT